MWYYKKPVTTLYGYTKNVIFFLLFQPQNYGVHSHVYMYCQQILTSKTNVSLFIVLLFEHTVYISFVLFTLACLGEDQSKLFVPVFKDC